MADIKTNQSKLYKALKGVGFKDLGSEEQFAAKLQDANNRQKLYKAMQKQGFKDLGDYNSFEGRIYEAPKQEPAIESQPTNEGTAVQQPQQKPYTPSWQDQMRFGMTVGNAEQVAKGAVEGYNKTAKNIETYQKQQAVTGGVAKSAPKWNPETGEMEQTYLTSAGTEHKNQQEAEGIQRQLNDAYWREAHPLEAAEREIGQDMRDIRREEELNTDRRREAEGEQPQGWWETFKRYFGASAITGMQSMGGNMDRDQIEREMLRNGAYGSERQAIAKEQDVILARRRLAEDAMQLLSDVRKDQNGYGMLGGLRRAGEKVLETALNPHTWDFGEADLQSQMAVADAVIKMDSGLGVSDNERKLLDTWAKNAAINSQFADQLSGWTKAGMVTGESLPFMLEMAMNPASGLGEAATTQMIKYSLKKYGTKWVKDHAKSMLAKKIATRLIGDVVGSGVMATTTGWARVASDAESRMTGQVDIGLDTNGDVIYKGVKDKESPAAAIFKGLSATAIENWSEMAGEYFGFINNFFGKALGKTVVGKAGRKMLAETGSIEGVSLNKAQKFIYELAAGKGIGAFSQGLKQFADRTQWHGVIGEYLEEEVGNIANAIVVGDMTLDTAKDTGVFNLQQNIDTFCGVALMGGFMSTLHTAGFVAHKVNYDVDRVSAANAKLFGDDFWNRIKTTIDSSIGDPRGLNDTLTDLLGGDDAAFDVEGKKAILKYAQAALEKQGAEMANYQPRMASSETKEETVDGQKQYVVTSLDKNGDEIGQQAFATEDEAKAYEGELKMQQQQQDYTDYLSMTNKLSYPEATQAVDEFIRGLGDGFDYAETVAAINDPKSELGKQFLQFKTEKILQKAEANRQAIEAFEEQSGWSPGTVQWLSEQDPMQLDAEGLQMMDQARTFLEGLAYPAGEVHTEHEQQVGADTAQAVVENVISTEEPIDPNNNAGQQLLDSHKAAVDAMSALFDRNEELKEEFYRLQGMGLSPQEVISSLDTFRPEDVQTIIDFYNANARYQSFMDEAGKQIDNVARQSRERRTFHGTINGAEDTQNIITITDGTNSYHLVSGNIQTDGAGVITGSDSGLIIGVDQNGDFVQIGDTQGHSVLPNMLTLDQWEDLERTRLQEAVTLTIDPNGAMGEEQEASSAVPAGDQGSPNVGTEGSQGGTTPPATTALSKIPKDEQGNPLYTQAEAGDTYDALVEQVGEDGAGMLAQSELNDAQKRLEKMEKDLADGKIGGTTMQEKIAAMQQMQQTIEAEKQNIAYWQNVLNVPEERRKANQPPVPPTPVVTAKDFIDRMNAVFTVEEVDAIYQEGLAAGIPESELLQAYANRLQELSDDVPEYRYDTPEAARKRGYKKVEGQRIDRQEEKPMPQGMEVEVQYSTKDKVKGRMTVSELGEVQGSHLVNGQRNDKNFIPEAQPKSEFGADRQAAAQSNASEANFRPELMLTFNGVQSAYSGSTTQTNRRGEVIQGNGRRNLAEFIYAPGNEKVAERYKQFLMAHAEELGTTAEAIAQMEKPFAHIVLDVNDEEAIRLGQFTAQDLETGGKKIPDVTTTVTKLGDKFGNLANIVLNHEDPDASLAERIESNAEAAINWLNRGGYINNTEAKTLLEDKQLARQFIKDLITDTLFSGVSPDLKTMFYELPKNIQSAIVSVVGREIATNPNTTILKDIQESIQAYHELMVSSPQFAGVKGKNYEERKRAANAAVGDWLRQINIDGTLNKGKFSNFALELAKLYRSLIDQKTLATRLREYYDLVGGAVRQLGMFDETPTSGATTREEAIKQIFGIEYGRERTVPLAGNNQGSEGGRGGSSDNTPGRKRGTGEGRSADNRGGDSGSAAQGGVGTTPLTIAEIDASSFPKQVKTLAKAYLNGNHGELQTAAYQDIYDEVRGEEPAAPAEPQQPTEPAAPQAPTTPSQPITADPMAAIEQAAGQFRAEQQQGETEAEATAKVADALAEAQRRQKDLLEQYKAAKAKRENGGDGKAMSVVDPLTATIVQGARIIRKSSIPQSKEERKIFWQLVQNTADLGHLYIQQGIRDFKEWSQKIINDLVSEVKDVFGWDQEQVDDYLDKVWNSEVEANGETKTLAEWAGEKPNNANEGDNSVNVNKEEDNEPKNDVPLQGDSAEFAEKWKGVKQLRIQVRGALWDVVVQGRENRVKTMADVKRMAKEQGVTDMSDTDLQELVESEIVSLARDFAHTAALGDEQKFLSIVKLYQAQPSLNARDNDRINKQQYSTPAPMAYLMGKFVDPALEAKSGLEPSAGNGMLTIRLPKEIMHVNDIDEMRLSNLQQQGFRQVTNQDGTQPFGERQYDVVLTNPPFGSVAAKTYDGYTVTSLEQQMVLNALESMKDDGHAAIIIGGNTQYKDNGTISGKDKAFLNYLYSHYNVIDVINMDGKALYSRQGTGYDVRMILISGRKAKADGTFAPVESKARAEQVKSYDELYKRVNDDILQDRNKSADILDTARSGEGGRVDDSGNVGGANGTGVRNVRTTGGSRQPESLATDGRSVSGSDSSADKSTQEPRNTGMGGGLSDVGSRTETSQPSGTANDKRVGHGANDTQRPTASTDDSVGLGQRGAGTAQQNDGGAIISRETKEEKPAVKRGLGTEKVPYRKQSGNPFTLQSLMPAEQADVVKKALEELGDVDQFLVDELGYSSKEELHGALAAEQIDSVAMAIHQMNQGSAFIIGDQTGIGKGRQAAALIRYGVKKGGCPVFITVKKALFSDMYRDLCDIGSPKLRPFIWSADDTEHSGNVTDKNGNVVYQTPSAKEQKRVIEYINKYGKLPPEYDYVLTTYDSFKSGTMDYENGQKKARSFGKKQPGPVHYNGQAKRDALETLAGNSYVIMDESHNAGGEGSNVSNYLQYITTKAKGLTFLSATFAKRPGNMPIYSLKTAIAKAGVKVEELIDAVKRGGATFQEIMSKALTEAGQMIRRERDMTGVTIDWRGIEDEAVIQKQREQYDTIIGLFNDIIDFQRAYVDPIVNKLNDDAADEQGEVDHTPGTRDMGINNTPFASRTYNMVQQVLLSLKAEEAAKRAIEHLKAGRKPVITVANTNEGAADEAAGMGADMEMPDLSVNLKKGLQGTLRITKKDAFGNSTNETIPFERLSEEGRARYQEIMDAIENASSGLSLSPIDVIKNELKKAGYKVGELTGRKAEFVYNEDGMVKRVKRQDTDKKRIAADFNNGNLDALILNRSAGTGISLHASSTFKDQRQRIMIVAQAQGDVNDEVQIRGRIDRTGQVLRGMYEYVVSQIPSEQRLLMMLKAKLRSLDANTTSSQKSKFNEMQVQDIINKYGDEIVIQYLAEHPDLAMKMCDPLKWGEGAETLSPETLISQATKPTNGGDGATASKVLGRMALLKVAEQEKMLQELGDLYQAEIDRLNEMGENDLEITEMPLKAKTLKKDVWEEGVEPGGKNPFADNSYVETVEMDVLKKPMKAEEVKKAQARLLGSVGQEGEVRSWEDYKQATMEKVDAWAEQKKEETRKTFTERAEKKATAEKEKYAKGAKKAQEKNGMTDEEIERMSGYQYETIYKQEIDKLNNALEAIDKQKQAFVDALETFTTDGVYALPTDIYDLSQLTFEPSFGKLIDIKIMDNFSTAASTITFATLDGRRKITIPISGMVKQNNGEKRDIKPTIVSQTAQTRNGMFGSNMANMLKVLEQNTDNWDKLTSTATRKQGYIITGNLLKALTELRKQGKGGKLISYTTDTGEIRQGILMSDQFDPKTLTSKNPISSAKAELGGRYSSGSKIVSADKEVEIRNNGWDSFSLKVPKSKKKGEKFFNDKKLLELVHGQFEGSTRLSADFDVENLDAILQRLDELGVTVESAKEEDANNSQNSLSRNTEVQESAENDVPLERRTMKSYTDKEGNYHEGIEDELAGLESAVAAGVEGETDAAGRESETVRAQRPNNGRGINEQRRQAAKLRAEQARRTQKKQELRQKYNIDEKGNISLDDLSRMFHDLNDSKVLGRLFDKVVKVLKGLGVEYRFTDTLPGNVGGRATAFINVTFYNWDSQLRDLDNQEKARILLHELIHNVGSQILFRFENPSLGELTKAQKKLAQEINHIYEVVDKANPLRENGKRPYGLEDAHEMLAELANPEFRAMLNKIPYDGKRSVWQQIKDWFRRLIDSDTDIKKGSTLDSLNSALNDILESYDKNEQRIYRSQREGWERQIRDAGYKGDYVDFWEDPRSAIGYPSIVEDKALIDKLDSEPHGNGYRTVVQNEDGTFGSPMAGRLKGRPGEKSKATSAYKMNQWEQSEENPHLANDKGKITLVKPGGFGDVSNVDYNPYIHIRENKLNKQFKNAWERPELVYIEVEYPESEMKGKYRAEKAAKSVGRHKWPGGDLILSRWDKPTRVVPWEEVADDWEREFKKKGVHFDIVSPHLLPILARRGVEILPPHKNMGDECNAAYERFKEQQRQELADPMEAIRRAARQFSKKSETPTDNSDPMEAIRRAAADFRRDSADSDAKSVIEQSAKSLYEQRLNTTTYVASEAFVDSMKGLDEGQKAIAKGKDIPDSQNAYMAENLAHGKNKNEQDAYNRNFRDPLLNIINTIMAKTGMRFGDIDRYVYTKSGLERNREFFVRDWLKSERNKRIRKYEDLDPTAQEIFDQMAARIEEDFEDGTIPTEEAKQKKLAQALQRAHQQYVDGVESGWQLEKGKYRDKTFPEYLESLDKFIRTNIDTDFDASEHDYSGFRAMFGDEKGKYDEAKIISDLVASEGKMKADNVDELWDRINAANTYALERYREAGMRSDEEIDKIEQMFHWYVPMRGFAEKTGEDMYQYFTRNADAKSYVGGLLKKAKGRGSEASYPIATMFTMAYKAISDCNQNMVKQKLYRLCQANENDLVVISDSWAVLNETTGEYEESMPDINEDMTEEEIRQETLRWEEDMRQKANDGKAVKLSGKATLDYKPIDPKKRDEHVVEVRINGKKMLMTVTGNPRMAQAINGELRYSEGDGIMAKAVFTRKIQDLNRTFLRFRQAVSTNYSLNFVWRNAKRDWSHFGMLATAKEGAGYATAAEGYYFQTLAGKNSMRTLFKKYREGTLDETKEIERDFKDFMDNGGITGFVQMQKVDEIQRDMESLTKKIKKGGEVKLKKDFWGKIKSAIEAYNEAIENRARFATYRASRHYAGRTKARSAYDAKEITANFNRRGAGKKTAGFKSESEKVMNTAYLAGRTSQILNANRMFFNATVQSIATLGSGLENADTKTKAKFFGKRLAVRLAKYGSVPFVLSQLVPLLNMALIDVLGGGDDDPYANLPEWVRRNNLCLYIGNGNFFTFALGQELAAFYSLGDMIAGQTYYPELKPVDKTVKDEIVGFLSVFSPVDMETKVTKENTGWVEGLLDNYVARVYSNAAPLVQVANNISWTGRPIYREDRYPGDELEPEYKMTYGNTPKFYKYVSQGMNMLGGGDEVHRGGNVLGVVDSQINPGTIQYLVEQYMGGVGRTFINTGDALGDGIRYFTGRDQDFNVRKIEGVRALFQQSDDRTQYFRTQAKYRKYKKEADALEHDIDGYIKDADSNPDHYIKLIKLTEGEGAARLAIIKNTESDLSQLRKAINATEGQDRRELQRVYNQAIKSIVDDLDNVPKLSDE